MTTEPKLQIIAGKGGVGRSTIAAGLALAASRDGKRVLLIDAVNDGGSRYALGNRWLRQDGPEIQLMELDTVTALDEYLRIYLRFPIPPSRLGPIARIFEFVATAAPGVTEILTIGKIAHEAKNGPWDLVVVDAPATGHVVELLAAPRNLEELISVGPLADQTGWVVEFLADPSKTGIWLVSTCEELPVSESLELLNRIRNETQTHVLGAVLNRIPLMAETSARPPLDRAVSRRPDSPLGRAIEMIRDRAQRAATERARFVAGFQAELPGGILLEVDEAEDPVGEGSQVWATRR